MKLKGHVKAVSQRNRNNRCCAVYSVTNSRGFTPSTDYFSKEIYSKDLSTYKLVEKGMIAYNPSRINVGSVALQDKAECVIVSPLYVVFCVDETLLCPEYVTYFLKSEPGLRQIDFRSIGTVRNNFTFDALEKMELRVPSVGDQLHVVSIIRRVESVIESTKQKSNQLDDLVKSRFAEMFGDVDNTPYEIKSIQECCEKIKDGTHQTPTYVDKEAGGVMFLSSKNVVGGTIDWNTIKYIPFDLHEKLHQRVAPRQGDILLAKNGTTGVCAIVDRDCVFDVYVSLAHIRPLKWMDSTYMWAAINADRTKEQFNSRLKGVGVPNLHLGEIKQTLIVVPPLALQQEFANFVSQVDKLRFETQQQIEKLETLKKSLMQEYFG